MSINLVFFHIRIFMVLGIFWVVGCCIFRFFWIAGWVIGIFFWIGEDNKPHNRWNVRWSANSNSLISFVSSESIKSLTLWLVWIKELKREKNNNMCFQSFCFNFIPEVPRDPQDDQTKISLQDLLN